MKKKMGFMGLAVTLVTLSLALGYLYGQKETELVRYDNALFRLSIDAHVIDALESGKIDEAKLVLLAGVEGNASIVAQTYQEYPQLTPELRCFVTRKARQWHAEEKILADRQRLKDLEYPVDAVIDYLSTQCPGELPRPNSAQ